MPGVGVDSGVGGDRFAFSMSVHVFRDKRTFPLDEGNWDDVERAFREAEPAIFLPELTARKLDMHVGDFMEIETLEGPVPFYVAGVGGAFPVISPDSAERYFGSYPFGIIIEPLPGVARAEVEARVDALMDRHSAEVGKFEAEQIQSVVGEIVGPIQGLFAGLTSLSGLVAALGILVTLFASVFERQRELGTLRAMGMRANAVRGLVVTEAGLLGLAGATLGAAGGLGMAALFEQAINDASLSMLGAVAVEQLALPWELAAASVLIGPAVAMLAALYPADRAASVNPAEAMRAEGAAGFLKPARQLGPTGLRGLLARMPLAAKLSLTAGLVLTLAMTIQTLWRVDAERRLLEENLLSLFARASDANLDALSEQLPDDLSALTPATLDALQQQAGAQASALQAQLQRFRARQGDDDFQVRYAFVTDLDRSVIYSDEASWLGRVLTDTVTPSSLSTAVRLTDWSGERVFEATVPVENRAGVRLGYLQIGVSTSPVDNFIGEVVTSSLWTLALTLAAAVGLTVWFTRRSLAPVAQIAEASNAVARGDLTRRIPETRWDEVGRLARAFNDMVAGLNERERMRDLFGRYVSREVSDAVLRGRVQLGGERRAITCLFCDMRGSTAFAEKHPPEAVLDALNQYFEDNILATQAHGGIVNRFVGDEAVCVFGAPTAYPDHADRAVQAALAIRDGFAYVGRRRAALGQPTLTFGLGLNSGEVVAGATGSDERQEYTVIGDAMNAGARLQALTKEFAGHDIVLSEDTRAALNGRYVLDDLGEVELRGKARPVRVFGLRGPAG
jgi:class 3 adenylate cyclase